MLINFDSFFHDSRRKFSKRNVNQSFLVTLIAAKLKNIKYIDLGPRIHRTGLACDAVRFDRGSLWVHRMPVLCWYGAWNCKGSYCRIMFQYI